jgi:hypothetical protein
VAGIVPLQTYHLSARISSDSPGAVRTSLERFVGKTGTIQSTEEGFRVEAEIKGDSARELNRRLLTELRRGEKKTRLRAEWSNGTRVERFFDYVPKGVRSVDPVPSRSRST